MKSFEEYFFDQRPRLTPEYIRLLFQGKSGADGEGGLIQTCGDFGYSHVASRAALYLLCRLLDVEKNKDAQLFVDQFVSLEVNVLRKMQLHLHILSERGNRLVRAPNPTHPPTDRVRRLQQKGKRLIKRDACWWVDGLIGRVPHRFHHSQ